jgi:hypothetical protein
MFMIRSKAMLTVGSHLELRLRTFLIPGFVPIAASAKNFSKNKIEKAAVMKLCDGAQVCGICRHWSTMMKKPKQKARSAGKSALVEQIHAAGLYPPEKTTIMVTDGCNLYCRHCWLDCKDTHSASPVPVTKIGRVINDFTLLGGSQKFTSDRRGSIIGKTIARQINLKLKNMIIGLEWLRCCDALSKLGTRQTDCDRGSQRWRYSYFS